jgi:hypothetical protein
VDLKARGVDCHSGGAGNFVCIAVPGGRTREFCAALERESIYVRDISARFPGFVRITVCPDMQRVCGAAERAFLQLQRGYDVALSDAAVNATAAASDVAAPESQRAAAVAAHSGQDTGSGTGSVDPTNDPMQQLRSVHFSDSV